MPPRRKLTEDEIGYVRANYGSVPRSDIAERLGVSRKFVEKLAAKLGVNRPLRRWSAEEDEVVRSAWGNRRLGDVARQLGRDASEVSARARKLGIIKGLGRWRSCLRRRDRNGYLIAYYRREAGYRYARPIAVHMDVMEGSLGRRLRRGEVVHHINTDKDDNRIDNLYLCRSPARHGEVHRSLEKLLPALLRDGVVRFDRANGVYVLCETVS